MYFLKARNKQRKKLHKYCKNVKNPLKKKDSGCLHLGLFVLVDVVAVVVKTVVIGVVANNINQKKAANIKSKK